MGTEKVMLFRSFLFVVSFVHLSAMSDAAAEGEVVISELERLRSEVSALETSYGNKIHELKRRDDSISRMQKVILEKSENIHSLQRMLETIEDNKGFLVDMNLLEEDQVRAMELQKQIAQLQIELQAHIHNQPSLEIRTREAEQTVDQISQKMEFLQRTNDEQKIKAQKTEHSLKLAEEKMMEAQIEVESIKKELTELYASWLPPWLTIRFEHFITANWNRHGRPIMDVLQVVRKFLQPYFSGIMNVAQSHVEKLYIGIIFLMDKAIHTFGEFMNSVSSCHQQVQSFVQEKLKKYKLTEDLATREFVWSMVSVFIALLVYILYKLVIVIIRKKPRKFSPLSRTKYTHRKHKHKHA